MSYVLVLTWAFWPILRTQNRHHPAFVENNGVLIGCRIAKIYLFLETHRLGLPDSILKEIGLVTAITQIRRWKNLFGHRYPQNSQQQT
jgi:hypothetical protein